MPLMEKKRTLFSLFEQIGRTTAVLIKSTSLVKIKKKKKKVSIDAQEENRNQNYLWKTEEIKMSLAVRYNQNFFKKITWACCVSVCKFVILGIHYIEASVMFVGDTVAVRISEVSARR